MRGSRTVVVGSVSRFIVSSMAATTPVLSRASDSDGAEEGAPVSPLLPVSRYGAVDTPEAAVQGASGELSCTRVKLCRVKSPFLQRRGVNVG